MKTTPLVVAALAAAGLLSAPILKANTNRDESKSMPAARVQQQVIPQRIILVQTTESRIPKRVVVAGNQVNGASPLYVLQSRDLLRTGAIDVAGMLRIDPSISFVRH